MSNLFKYKISLDSSSVVSEPSNPNKLSPDTVDNLAFVLVGTIITTVFSTIVVILNRCFPGSLDGTYLKLFF